MKTCGRCARAFDPAAWASLRVVERLRYEQLRDLLTEWPWTRDTLLEVRACRCGATLSQLVR